MKFLLGGGPKETRRLEQRILHAYYMGENFEGVRANSG